MELIEEKLKNKISQARFTNINIIDIQYNNNEAIITVKANDERTYDNQNGFGKIEFEFTIDSDGRAYNFKYINYNDIDIAKGGSCLQNTSLPDEDDPTYSECVEKIIQEQLDFCKNCNSDLFDFFRLPTNYSDCLDKSKQEIYDVFSNYFKVDKIELDKFQTHNNEKWYNICIYNAENFSVGYDKEFNEWSVSFWPNDDQEIDGDWNNSLSSALRSLMNKVKKQYEITFKIYNDYFKN